MALDVPRQQADYLVGSENNVIDATRLFVREAVAPKYSPKIALAGVHAFLHPEEDANGMFEGEDGAERQLRFMGAFWQAMDIDRRAPLLADLPDRQYAWLGSLASGMRVLPTPLLDYSERVRLLEQGVHLKGNVLNPARQIAMLAPLARCLTQDASNSHATYPTAQGTYVLRYKLPTVGRDGRTQGDYVDQRAYARALVERGEAIELPHAEGNARNRFNVWILSRVNMQDRHDAAKVGQRYEALDHTVTTEAQLALQLLDQADGAPQPDVVGLSNEVLAIRRRRFFGGELAVRAVMGVHYVPSVDMVRMLPLTLDSRAGDIREHTPRMIDERMSVR